WAKRADRRACPPSLFAFEPFEHAGVQPRVLARGAAVARAAERGRERAPPGTRGIEADELEQVDERCAPIERLAVRPVVLERPNIERFLEGDRAHLARQFLRPFDELLDLLFDRFELLFAAFCELADWRVVETRRLDRCRRPQWRIERGAGEQGERKRRRRQGGSHRILVWGEVVVL